MNQSKQISRKSVAKATICLFIVILAFQTTVLSGQAQTEKNPELARINRGGAINPGFISLLSSPERYNGKIITCIGVLRERDGVYSLFISKEASEYWLFDRSITVFIGKETWRQFSYMSGMYVGIHGVFRFGSDKDGLFRTGISDIQFVLPWHEEDMTHEDARRGKGEYSARASRMHPVQQILENMRLESVNWDEATPQTVVGDLERRVGQSGKGAVVRFAVEMDGAQEMRVTVSAKDLTAWQVVNVVAGQLGGIVKIFDGRIVISDRCYE